MKTILQLSGVIALAAFGYLCFTLSIAVRLQQKHLAATEMQMGDVTTALVKTMAKVNLEVDELHRVTLEAGLTAMEARKASKKESAYLDQWNAQLSGVLRNVNGAIGDSRATIAAATSAIKATQETAQALQGPINQTTATLQALQPVIAHADALVSDPNIPATVANVRTMTVNGDAATKDLKDYIHGILHPSWPKRLWNYSVDLAHAIL